VSKYKWVGRLGQKEKKGSDRRPKCQSPVPLPLVVLPPLQPTCHSLPIFLCARGRGGAEAAGRSGVLVGGMQMRAWQRRADVRG
jgi:hypothetical protein